MMQDVKDSKNFPKMAKEAWNNVGKTDKLWYYERAATKSAAYLEVELNWMSAWRIFRRAVVRAACPHQV